MKDAYIYIYVIIATIHCGERQEIPNQISVLLPARVLDNYGTTSLVSVGGCNRMTYVYLYISSASFLSSHQFILSFSRRRVVAFISGDWLKFLVRLTKLSKGS